MVEANANANAISKCSRTIPRANSDVIFELAYELREVSSNLDKLEKAIEANPQSVSEHHKELWRKQAKAMQDYVDVLGERIEDLIDSNI